MALNDYEFSYNGLIFGGNNPIGVIEVTGMTDLAVGLGDSPIPRGSGDVPGLAVGLSKEIIFDLKTTGPKRSQELADNLASALSAFSISQEPLPLVFKEPGVDEALIYCRVLATTIPRSPTLTHAMRPFSIRLKASDPRVYSSELHQETLGIYNPSGGGLDFDVDYGKEYVGGPTNEKVLNNAGNSDAYPLLRFYGPPTGTITEVLVTNLTTGQTCEITAAILINQILEADMGRIVTVDPGGTPYINIGGSNRYGDWTLPRTPFALVPGDNLLRYEVTGTSTDGLLVINHRDTWL